MHLEEFIKITVHDLRAPLANIVSLVHVLKQNRENDEEIIDLIESCGLRLLDKVEYLLKDYKFNSIEQTSGIKIRPDHHSVNTLIREVVKEAKGLASIKNQKVIFFDYEDNTAFFDKELIRVVIENILNNALKFSPDYSRVELFMQADDQWLSIIIKDEGQGFTADDKDKAFGKHAVLSARPTGAEHSSGLGLYICKQIIDEHNGFIRIQSEGLNKGTTFFINLPFQKEPISV